MFQKLASLLSPGHPRSRWPARLILVRHGQSAGNVARDEAHAAGHLRIDIADRDADVALSNLGVEQSNALGKWLLSRPIAERPEIILSSPYKRALQTAELVHATGVLGATAAATVVDERLREREFGILDRLTSTGIKKTFPEQATLRALLGKFYHRPPGGESWCDVILRLRSLTDTLSLHYSGRRVLIVTHEVIVLCFRYLLEDLDEDRILAIDRQGDIANCAITEYEYNDQGRSTDGSLVLLRYNETSPLLHLGAPVTTAPDAKVAAR